MSVTSRLWRWCRLGVSAFRLDTQDGCALWSSSGLSGLARRGRGRRPYSLMCSQPRVAACGAMLGTCWCGLTVRLLQQDWLLGHWMLGRLNRDGYVQREWTGHCGRVGIGYPTSARVGLSGSSAGAICLCGCRSVITGRGLTGGCPADPGNRAGGGRPAVLTRQPRRGTWPCGAAIRLSS